MKKERTFLTIVAVYAVQDPPFWNKSRRTWYPHLHPWVNFWRLQNFQRMRYLNPAGAISIAMHDIRRRRIGISAPRHPSIAEVYWERARFIIQKKEKQFIARTVQQYKYTVQALGWIYMQQDQLLRCYFIASNGKSKPKVYSRSCKSKIICSASRDSKCTKVTKLRSHQLSVEVGYMIRE